MKSRYFTLSLFTLFFLSSALIAEEQTESENKSETAKKIEVVVTASRGQEQNLLEVPQTIDSVTSEEISDFVYADVDDALRKLPGLGLAPSEGNPNYWQEGFTIRGLGAQRVLTLSDGVRQAGQGIGYGGGNLSLYDPFSIEKIEVLRGPASVLYGTDAFGGVINITTRNPIRRTESGANGGLRYSFDGSRDMHRTGAYLDFGDEDFGAVIGGSFTDASEPNLPDDIDPQSGSFENLGIWGKADFYIDNDSKIRVIANTDRNKDVNVIDSTITLPIATFPPPGSSADITSPLFFQFPEYSRTMAGVEYITENLSDSWKSFQTGFYYQRLNREFHRETAFYSNGSPGFAGPPLFFDPTASVDQAVVDTDDVVETYEWQTQTRHQLDNHELTFGLDVGLDESDLPEVETITIAGLAGIGEVSGAPSVSTARLRAKASQLRLGLYGQDKITSGDFEVTPGVRADFFTVEDDVSNFDEDEFGLSGSLGLLYHLNQENSLYGSLGTGFRVPDLGERFQTGIVNLGVPSQIIGKEDLDPERSYNAEIGVKGERSDFRYHFATFINQVQDYIGLRPLGTVAGFATDQYDNLGDVTLYGGEAGIEYDLTAKTNIFLNAARTWTDSTDKVDVLDWVFNYGVLHTEPVNSNMIQSIGAGFYGRTVLESEDLTPSAGRDTFDAPSFTVVDLLLNLKLQETKLGDVKLIAGVKNLFDKKYQEPFFPMYQPERAGYAGVEITF
ncbi:MAG: TonB-dependent receptor [Bdellovibrionales bacterium]|nr:TonB-dependent receptor [Bdellovibrionales bacterium]